MKILFIGNSHTFNNSVPLTVKQLAEAEGYDAQVAMIAHGGWTLYRHVKEPEAEFNILYGGYDYVVLQEHAHPFDLDGHMIQACEILGKWCRQANSVPVFYMTWTQKWERHLQDEMSEGSRLAALAAGGLLAPAGLRFWEQYDLHPELELFSPDGGHASAIGSRIAAESIWETIRDHGKKAR